MCLRIEVAESYLACVFNISASAYWTTEEHTKRIFSTVLRIPMHCVRGNNACTHAQYLRCCSFSPGRHLTRCNICTCCSRMMVYPICALIFGCIHCGYCSDNCTSLQGDIKLAEMEHRPDDFPNYWTCSRMKLANCIAIKCRLRRDRSSRRS